MSQQYVGIDVAKLRHAVAIIDEAGNRSGKTFSITNDRAGFESLATRLEQLGPRENVHIALEATGLYGWPLMHHLISKGFNTIVVNPLQTSAFAKTNIRRTKTDPIDAQTIADLLRSGLASAAIQPDERSLRLRELTRYRLAVLSLACRFRNLLGSRVSRLFPELHGLLPTLWNPTALAFLDRFPMPADIAAMESSAFHLEVRTLSEGRWSTSKILKLHEQARITVGIPVASDVFTLQLRGIVFVIRQLQEHLDQITRKISAVLHEQPEVLTSIPGVADLTAASILGEIVSVTYFDSPQKLVAFAGFDPSTFQTGLFKAGSGRISKRGSPYLRRAIWNAALPVVRFNMDLRAYYEKKRAQGKHAKLALGCVCRKLLHVIWRLLKDNRPFENRQCRKADTSSTGDPIP